MPASFAIAGKCKAAFVDPPEAATTRAAFSNDFKVTISLGRKFNSINFITCFPAAREYSSLDSYGAGAPVLLGNAKPIASLTQAIVFAVNCPPHEPADGHAARSIKSNSSASIIPASFCPTASYTS